MQTATYAEGVPPKFETGVIFNCTLNSDRESQLQQYAKKPEAKYSRDIIDFVIEEYQNAEIDFLKSKDVILFLSIKGISQVVHIGKAGGFKKYVVDPDEIRITSKDFVAVWVVDNVTYYSTSVEVDITKSTRSVHLSSFESPPIFEDSGYGDDSKVMEIGVKYFEIPIYSGNLDIAFIRRDFATLENRMWRRSFRIMAVPSILGVGFEAAVFLPISDAKTKRYEVSSNVIKETTIDTKVFLTLTFFTPAERRFSRRFVENLIPDPFIGIGLPYDLDLARNNSYIVGCSWRYKSDLLRFSLALKFGDKLLSGYSPGDIAAEGQKIVDKFDLQPMIGISMSLTYISELVTGI